MKNSLQLNILFMVLLITSCFGGPIPGIKRNSTLSNSEDGSKNKDLSDISQNNEGITIGDIKPTAEEALKLDATIEPVNDSNKNASNVPYKDNVIQNFNYVNSDSTAVSNKDVKELASGTDTVSVSTEAFNPPASTPVVVIADDHARVPVKSEDDNQLAAGNVNVKNDTIVSTKVNDTGMENTELNSNGSKVANETVSDRNTEDEKLPSGHDEVIQENIADNSPGNLETNVDKPSETVSENVKVTTNNPDLEKIKDTEPQPEQSSDSKTHTQIETHEPSADLESSPQTENQKTGGDSESSIQTDNQEPIDVVNKTPTDVSVQTAVNIEASKSSTTSTQSSFNFDMGDQSPSYAQSSDQDYPNQYSPDDNENESSIDDQNEGGINSVDTAPYDKNDQEKLTGPFTDDRDSHFFAYFLTIMVTAIVFYLLFHNKQRVGQALGCVTKNERLKRIKEEKTKEPLLKSSSTNG